MSWNDDSSRVWMRCWVRRHVSPDLLRGVLPRLETFVKPFVEHLPAQHRRHAAEYVTGLMSKLERKTGEGIAYLLDQQRQGIQKFLGEVPWDHQPMLRTLAAQVGQELGEPDGVIVFDPSGFPKKGTKSVGVAKQWCGRLGKVENCQVGIYMGYVTRKEHAIVDVRLYLPEDWAKDRARRKEAGVPKSRFRPGTNWHWRCWRGMASRCHTPGSPATTKWADPAVFA